MARQSRGMFYRFDTAVPLRWVDVDSAGVVNNATYLSLVEQARFAYFDHLGLMAGHEVPFVLAEANVRFKRPGRLGMDVVVAARTSRLGQTSFQMEYEIRNGEEILAESTAALVFVGADLKPCTIPAPFRAAVAQFEDLPDASDGQ
ncbi:MAG: acyl-CoA thioesterase [Planctomycetota bacterium]